MTQAQAICATAAQKIKAGATTAFPHPNQAGWQDPSLIVAYANNVVLPALQAEHDQLATLRTSDADFHSMLSQLQPAINRWGADKTLMSTVNDTTFRGFDATATDLGLKTCATIDAMVRSTTAGEPLST